MKISNKLVVSGIFILFTAVLFTVAPQQANAQDVSVMGTVLEPDLATPVHGASVVMHDSAYNNWYFVSTGSDGSFEFYDTVSDTYEIEVYGNHSEYRDPEPFNIYYSGSGIYDIGAILLREESVVITITESDDTTAVFDYQVCIRDIDWYWTCDWTDVNGVVSFAVSTHGTYFVEFWSSYQGESSPDNFNFTYSGTDLAYSRSLKAPNVWGYIKAPDDTPCSDDCSINFWDFNWNNSYWAEPDENGYFALNIDLSKTFYYRVDYWGDEIYSPPEETTVVIDASQNNDLGTLYLVNPNITGKFVDPDGNGIPNAWVDFHSSNWNYNRGTNTADDGTFGFAVSTNGTYYVDFWLDTWTYPDYASPATQTVTYSGSAIDLGNIEVGVPAMKIKVTDGSGNPMAYANVDVHDQNWSMNGSYWGSTDENGVAVIDKEFTTGTYYMQVNPPWDAEGLLPSNEIAVSLTEGETNTTYYTDPIELSAAQKRITGKVTYPDGRAVTDAQVETWAMGGMYGGYSQSQTNSSGNYTLWVGQGEYQVNIWPNWGGGEEPDWGSPGPTTVEFTEDNNVTEIQVVNLTVAEYNATLRGKIVMPDGSALDSNLQVSVDAWEKGGFMGNWGEVDSNGNFSLSVAGGRTYEIYIWSWSMMMGGTEYGGPTITPTKIGDGETLNLGTLRLVEKSATISGKVTDTNGEALANQYIDAWSTTSMGWGSAMSDDNGNYSLSAFPGTYMIHAFPSWEPTESGAQYVSIEPPVEVTALANITVPNINFQLGIADATIKGHLEDPDGNLISGVWGWVNASNSLDSFSQGDMWYGGMLGGPLNGGQFEIMVPAGDYSLDVFMDWNGSYTQDSKVSVEIASGETKDDVVITMLENNAVIEGKFVDSEGNTVYNIWGEVFAKRPEGGSAYTWVDWNGTYSLNIAAGTWNMDYFIDPWMGAAYMPSSLEEKTVTVGDGETVTLNFTLLEADSEISGIVKDQDGTVIEGAHVFASLDYAGYERDSAYDHYGFNSMEATSGADGMFVMYVPEGEYYLNASLPPTMGYIFTGAQIVYASPDDPADDIVVVFESADSQITGEVLLGGTGNEAFIYAYTDTGGYSETTTSDGTYTIPVTSGNTWMVGAVDEDGNSYYLTDQEEVPVSDEDGAEQDLTLEYQGEMPDSTSSTFDSTVAKTMVLSDGMELEIPARSLATDGSVTVTIEPTADIPYQAGAQPLAGYGYELEARDSNGSLISNFNSDVSLTLPYDDATVAEVGIEEDDLSGEFYDTTSGVWEETTANIPDTVNDTMTVTTDHFSVFGAVAPGSSILSSAADSTLSVTVTTPVDNAVVTSDSVLVSGTVTDADAVVTIRRNGVSTGTVTVSSSGAFSKNITGLVDGTNTVTVDAVAGLESASTVTRTVVYSGGDGTAIDSVTNIPYDVVVMTNEDSAPQIRVFNPDGTLVSQFYAYSESYRGEFRVITADVDGDNQMEIIVYPYGDGYGPQVRLFEKDGTFIAHTMAFAEDYRNGIQVINNVDIDQDGMQDFVVVPRSNGGPNLRAYKYNTVTGEIELLAWTLAYDATFRGEINLSAADVTGDGNVNIIVSPADGGPNVRVFHYDTDLGTLELDGWFMAYQQEFRGGVLTQLGDVNGDGVRDIVTYPQSNGGANVRAYTYDSDTGSFELINWIQPYASTYRGTLSVKLADLDKDGQLEIVTIPATDGGPNLRVYGYSADSGEFELKDWKMVFQEDFKGGVGLGLSNMDGDAFREIVVYPLLGGGPNIRVYEYDADGKLTLLDWTLAYAENFRGEMSVKVADLDGDGVSSLVVSPLNEGGPNVRIFDVTDGEFSISSWFMAYGESFRGGVLTKFIN